MGLVNSMINPWESSEEGLVSLSSGTLASDDVSTDLLSAEKVGKQKMGEFIDTRISNSSEKIFDPLKQLKLKTFAHAPKVKTVKTKQLQTERHMFARMILVAKSREISMKEVLSYSLSDIPAALASADLSNISKTNKASLLHVLENDETTLTENKISNILHSAVIVDAMALLQSISTAQLPATFAELASLTLNKLVTLAKKFKATEIDFVGDQYLDCSIKM